MFASDRDLLSIEPGLLRMVGWLGQTVARSSDASIDSSGLALTASDGDFVSAGVDAGYIVLVGNIGYEVLGAGSSTQLVISRVRASASDPGIPGESGSGLDMRVVTFRPQIGIAHREILRMGGIEEGEASGEGVVSEGMVTNAADLRLLEATRALQHVFAAAAASGGQDESLVMKAERYGQMFEQERQRVRIEIDLDWDGVADAARSVSMFRMRRA